MITCQTLREAQKVPNVIRCHFERNGTISAYQEGDTLPPELKPQPVNPAMEQIEQLESQVTPRMLREAALGIDNTRLAAINSQIDGLRKKL